MASKKVQEFVTRNSNVGKSVELTLNTGKVYYGILESFKEGKEIFFTVKTGKRGRPPRFAETDIKSVKHYKAADAMPVAQKGKPTRGKPEITKPVNTSKPQKRPQTRPQVKPQAKVPTPRTELDHVVDPTPEEIAAAEELANQLLAEPLSA